MLIASIGNCEGCRTLIFPFRNEIYTCKYCGEKYKYKKDGRGLERISQTTLPLKYKTLNLCDIVEQFENAERVLDEAYKEYKKALRLYEEARPQVFNICWWAETEEERKEFYKTVSDEDLLKIMDNGTYINDVLAVLCELANRKHPRIKELARSIVDTNS